MTAPLRPPNYIANPAKPPTDNGVPPGPVKQGFALRFWDEFTGVETLGLPVAAPANLYVDRSRWTTTWVGNQRRLPYDNQRQIYLDEQYTDPLLDPDAAINPMTFSQSTLRMRCGPIPRDQWPLYHADDYRSFYGCCLNSEPVFMQAVGVWEMRAQLPRVRGVVAAFWLLSNADDFQWPPEIDIFEFFAAIDAGDIHAGVYGREYAPYSEPDRTTTLPGVTPADDFHVYTVEINSLWVIFFFNNVEYWRTPVLASLQRGFLYTFITTSVGGDRYAALNGLFNDGPADPAVDVVGFPADWQIDWFRGYIRTA